jgi:hypothetical protein
VLATEKSRRVVGVGKTVRQANSRAWHKIARNEWGRV